MKITAAILCITFLQVAAHGYSQEKISLHYRHISFEKLFHIIGKSSDYSLVYRNGMLPDKKIDVDIDSMAVPDVINRLLEGTSLYGKLLSNKLIVITSIAAEARDTVISGSVTDSVTAKPLAGVTIQVKGSTVGTVTNEQGRYSLSVPEGSTLVISYLGYNRIEEPVNGRQILNITLAPSNTGLGEVVVIGYGTTKKATLTGSVSTINAEQLQGRPAARTTDLLQGMAPGLQIQRGNEGRIRGTESSITIRGVTSRSDPGVLVVVDGIPQSDDASYALDNINPNDIASISILKDAQAAIYGARAAGGVILVTTKSGLTAKPTINFSSTYTIQKPSLEKKSVNVLQLVEMMNEAYVNDGNTTNGFTHIVNYIDQNHLTMDEVKKNNGQYVVQWPFDQSANFVFGDYYWPKIMFHSAPMQIYNVSVSGKTNKLNYYNSVGYEDQNSMMRYGSNYNKRFFGRLKNDYDVTNWLKIKTNVELERQKVVEPYSYGDIEFWQGLIWPVFMPYTPEGHYYNFGSHQNPIGYAEKGGDITEIYYRIKSQLGFVLSPFKNFSITGDMANNFDIMENDWAALGFDMYNENDVFSYNSNSNRNSAGGAYNRTRSFVGNLFADYKFNLLTDHAFDFLVGYSHEEVDYREFGVQRNLGLISDQLPTFGVGSSTQQFNGESKTDRALSSFFSRLNYNYKGKYILEGNFRYDGSSKFAPGHKWSPFYGLSGAWTVSGENFMRNIRRVVDFLKLRASWGQLGNEASIGLYDYIPQINIDGSYPFGNSLSPSLTQEAYLAGLGSSTRTWERVDSKNIGIDFSTLQGRLSGAVDYYIKDNANMFYSKEFPQVLGIAPPSINGAHVRTKGWEVSVGWKDKIGAVEYSAGFNISNSTNKVIELADSRIPSMGEDAFVEGYPAYSYFGYKYDGLMKTQQEVDSYKSAITSGIPLGMILGDTRYKDLNGDGQLTPQLYQVGSDGKPTATSGDMVYLGDAGQHYLFGINLGAEWKNFYFSAIFQGVLKWMVYDGNRAFIADSWPQLSYFYHETWSPDRTDARYPRLSTRGDINNNNYAVSDAGYVRYNNKYIRLKNLQFGYNVPSRLTARYKISDLRIYFSGTDMYELYNLPGVFDPEKPFNSRITPFPRTYSFGINLTF